VKVGHRKNWVHLVTFTLRGGHITHPDSYITYSNSPHDLDEKIVRESEAALEALISRLRAPSSRQVGEQVQRDREG